MKRHFYAVMLLLGLSITVISCGGRNNSSDDSTTVTETIDTIEETLTNTLPDNPDIPTVEAASVDNMKMVLDNQGNLVGRYIGSNENTYVGVFVGAYISADQITLVVQHHFHVVDRCCFYSRYVWIIRQSVCEGFLNGIYGFGNGSGIIGGIVSAAT